MVLALLASLVLGVAHSRRDAHAGTCNPTTPPGVATPTGNRGVWLIQQVHTTADLPPSECTILQALATPGLLGFSERVGWNDMYTAGVFDPTLLTAGLTAVNTSNTVNHTNLKFSVRMIAGSLTPASYFTTAGAPSYLAAPLGGGAQVPTPTPFMADGTPNTIFEGLYRTQVQALAAWCRANGVHLLHLPWYGLNYAELNNGTEVMNAPGYSYQNWLKAHEDLVDIGWSVSGPDLTVEFPLSGYGPLVPPAYPAVNDLGAYIQAKSAGHFGQMYIQANGLGPQSYGVSDWGTSDPVQEQTKDAAWGLNVARGEQMITAGDYSWDSIFADLNANHADYVEIYGANFSASQYPKNNARLLADILGFNVLPPSSPAITGVTPGVGSAYVTWTAPSSSGGAAITKYSLQATDAALNQLPAVLTTSTALNYPLPGLSSLTSYTITVSAYTVETGPPSTASAAMTPLAGGTYNPLVPARILDTRPPGVGSAPVPLGPGQVINLQVTGQGGVPATGVSSVVLNMTVTDTTAASYLSVWPQGFSRPTVSDLNWTARQTVANLVLVAVGPTGQVSIFNPTGSVDVIADVQGYFGDSTDSYTKGGLYNPLTPYRILDTRGIGGVARGAPIARLGAGQTLNVQVTGAAGSSVPSTGVSAVALNVTAVSPSSAGYLTVWPTGSTRPTASNLNFQPGQVVPNRVIVKVGPTGMVSIFNPSGTVDVLADVGGWFTDDAPASTGTGSPFVAEVPMRIADTRNSPSGIGPGGVLTYNPPAPYATPHTALVLNVTAVSPTAAGYLALYPHTGGAPPAASDLNFVAGQVVPNLALVKLGPSSSFDTYNAPPGVTQAVFDEDGYFTQVVPLPPY